MPIDIFICICWVSISQHMKTILTVLILQSLVLLFQANANEFRFHMMEGCTGIPSTVLDQNGKITTIRFSKDSDSDAVATLNALISQDNIWGTYAPQKDTRGVTWDQGIILSGSFTSAVKKTPYIPNGSSLESFREFKLTGIKIKFPFAVWKETTEDLYPPMILELHFELRSLIPKGLVVNGKSLDLAKYELHSDHTTTSK